METAKAAMELYYKNLGKKPVKAVIFTHSHWDHYGGVAGVITQEQVDKGEVEVIVAGKEESVNFVVIDEITARNLAEAFSLNPIGTIGVLRLAKRAGLVDSIKPYLDELKLKKFRISDKIYYDILKSEGELTT